MAKGRRIGRIPFITPTELVKQKYFREWDAGELYHHPDRFPPISSLDLFGREGELILDLGCGSGEFIVGLASESPEKNFIGLDVSTRALYFGVDLAADAKLDNILFLHADANLVMSLIPDGGLSELYMLFPDPNYGSKHLKKRIINKEFITELTRVLRSDGKFVLVTDEDEFFGDMFVVIDEDGRLRRLHAEEYLNTFSPSVKTRFQKAWEQKQKPVFRLELAIK